MNSQVTTYQRLIRSAQAEQILERSNIFVDRDVLRPHIIAGQAQKSSEIYRYMKNASQNGGFVSTKYESKRITTARMFTQKKSLNLITLNDPRILRAIKSRYEDGMIVMMDYDTFEPSIMRSVIGDIFPKDIHTWASEMVSLDRKIIKKTNMEIIYGALDPARFITIGKGLMVNHGCGEDEIVEYLRIMMNIRTEIEEYGKPMVESFATDGFIVNNYGRKIFPKKERNIFNNVIQSIGSEILIEAIITLDSLLRGREAHILFHRFDALYFDISKQEVYRSLSKIAKTMESVDDSIDLSVGIQIGGDLTSLKELERG